MLPIEHVRHRVTNMLTSFILNMSRLLSICVNCWLSISPNVMSAPLQVIKAYTLIVSFMPAISALSGNLGLQASANTIRGLGTGRTMLMDGKLTLVVAQSDRQSVAPFESCSAHKVYPLRSYRPVQVLLQHVEGDEVWLPLSDHHRQHHLPYWNPLGLHWRRQQRNY